MRVMTYNVHSFVGQDGVYDPDRVGRVIELAKPDVVALQEVDFGRGAPTERSVIERLAENLSMNSHFTFTRAGKNGRFGNAVLSQHGLSLVAEGMLPRRRGEARAVQWLKVVGSGFQLELLNTHLSVNWWERRAQVRALLGAEWLVQALQGVPLVVCGDFNSLPVSGVCRQLGRHLYDAQRSEPPPKPTWPARAPLLRIDHIYVSREIGVSGCSTLRDGLARNASDHLPLVADLHLAPLPERR